MGKKADKENSLTEYLMATAIIDCDHAAIIDFAQKSAAGLSTPQERAIHLYYKVRDGIRYDPYEIDLSVPGMRASTTLKSGRGWCVPKAILLTACCRALEIPARLGFADVRNHLSTVRMRRYMRTDIFFWHGYTAIYLNRKWTRLWIHPCVEPQNIEQGVLNDAVNSACAYRTTAPILKWPPQAPPA